MRHYDYRKTWNYPAFQPDGLAPASVGYREDDARITRKDVAPNERIFEIVGQENTPVLLWEAFAGWQAPFTVAIMGGKLPPEWCRIPQGPTVRCLSKQRVYARSG